MLESRPAQLKPSLSWRLVQSQRTVVFVLALLFFLVHAPQAFKNLTPDPYALGDWLINYDGGFIRRGLAGETIFATQGFGVGIENFGILLCYVSAGTIILTMVIALCRLSKRIAVVPLLLIALSPAAGLSLLINDKLIGRKEHFMLIVTVAHLLLYMRSWKPGANYPRFMALLLTTLLSLISALCVLSHEAYIFLLLPFNAYLVAKTLQPVARVQYSAFLYSLPALCTGAFLFVQSKRVVIEPICDSWRNAGIVIPCGLVDTSPILYLTVSTKQAFEEVIYNATRSLPSMAIVFIAPVLILLFLLRFALVRELHAPSIFRIWMYITLPMLPLFVFALDWGRWLVLANTLLLLYLAFEPELTSVQVTESAMFAMKRTPRVLLTIAVVITGFVFMPHMLLKDYDLSPRSVVKMSWAGQVTRGVTQVFQPRADQP